MLVSLNGRDFMPGDLLQEFHNHLVEFLVERKGKDFDSSFLWKITRNLHHFNQIKKELREGMGLGKKVSHHSVPHLRTEYKILLRVYARRQLHKWQKGRQILERDTDSIGKGIKKLESKLPRWKIDRAANRGLLFEDIPSTKHSSAHIDSECAEQSDDTGDDIGPAVCATLGTMSSEDGNLSVITWSLEDTLHGVIPDLDDDESDEEEF
jgi:hypothetical protein